MVVLAHGPGCPSRNAGEPARSQALPISADNFPNEIARVCDSVGKSPAWRGLNAAFLLTSLWAARSYPELVRYPELTK